MERLGVIRKVDTLTEWCTGMVVVPKGNNKVRICVDVTKLNKSVCSDRHILPSVEQTLTQLQGAKNFTMPTQAFGKLSYQKNQPY